jgi:hypothetical protein
LLRFGVVVIGQPPREDLCMVGSATVTKGVPMSTAEQCREVKKRLESAEEYVKSLGRDLIAMGLVAAGQKMQSPWSLAVEIS